MRLLCVNNKSLPNCFNDSDALSKIIEGQQYEGVQDTAEGPDGVSELCWYLPKFRYHYAANRFIPCSDIDETELVNNLPEPAHA